MADAIKEFLNALTQPYIFTPVSALLLLLALRFYRTWTKPKWALTILGLSVAFFLFSMTDPDFHKMVSKPDNIAIVGMLVLVGFFVWVGLRQAALNDERIARGEPPLEKLETEERILVWPDLVYSEFLALIICSVVLVVWSILVQAPLEEPANPIDTPNPSKAPWYFLGLQEMLVYFDPWIAGVVFPGLIIMGLAAIPYLDKNPKGQGYFTLAERPFAISVFLFGFIILWVLVILLGTFLRGPNWNIFGPYEKWDVHKIEPLVNVNLSELFYTRWLHVKLPPNPWLRELPGFVFLFLYYGLSIPLLAKTVFRKMYVRMGFLRYSIMMTLLLTMGLLLLKMLLRWTLNLKYFVGIPEYFLNI